jgi:hypothetical protein
LAGRGLLIRDLDEAISLKQAPAHTPILPCQLSSTNLGPSSLPFSRPSARLYNPYLPSSNLSSTPFSALSKPSLLYYGVPSPGLHGHLEGWPSSCWVCICSFEPIPVLSTQAFACLCREVLTGRTGNIVLIGGVVAAFVVYTAYQQRTRTSPAVIPATQKKTN